MGFAISKFLELEKEYKKIEIKNAKFSDNFFTWT